MNNEKATKIVYQNYQSMESGKNNNKNDNKKNLERTLILQTETFEKRKKS